MNTQDRTLLERARAFHCKEAELLTTLANQEEIGPVTKALVATYRAQAAEHEAMAQAIARNLDPEGESKLFSLGDPEHPVRVGDAAWEAHMAQQRRQFETLAAAA